MIRAYTCNGVVKVTYVDLQALQNRRTEIEFHMVGAGEVREQYWVGL